MDAERKVEGVGGGNKMMDYIKKILPYALAVMVGAWVGFYIGTQYYPRIEIQTVTNTVKEQPIIVQGETKTETKTQIAYVPKENVIVKYIDPATGQEVTTTQQEKTDLNAQIGKMDFHVRLNGKDVQFTKTDDEQFIFDTNKIALNQSSMITFDATIPPQVIENTKQWGIGVGYGKNGIAYKLDFPVGNNNFGGWLYKDGESKAGGVTLRF